MTSSHSNVTHEQQRPNLDAHIIRALQAILAGHQPSVADTAPLTGDVKACITALVDALSSDGGVKAARLAFNALVKDNRPWLSKLASMAPPDEADALPSSE